MEHVFLAIFPNSLEFVITDQFSSNSKPLSLKLRAEGTFSPVKRADERQLVNRREQTSTGFHQKIAVTFALAYVGRPKTKEDLGITHKTPAVK